MLSLELLHDDAELAELFDELLRLDSELAELAELLLDAELPDELLRLVLDELL